MGGEERENSPSPPAVHNFEGRMLRTGKREKVAPVHQWFVTTSKLKCLGWGREKAELVGKEGENQTSKRGGDK